ncbi:DUF2975 domain-containing protein [Bacillus paramycoides]|uniref:DUF2975 domain-containing protein n=1 Tax=Bacillus paramycoides TaxID=2026194 RepID=UPI002E1CF091|nr:DUF2975 domain-containing protein [Bacillus paramycoides]
MRQKNLSVWLKLIIAFCWIFGLLFCIYIGPEIGRHTLMHSKSLKGLYEPFIIFIWVTKIPFFIVFIWITGIPFFITLVLGWQICSDIGYDQAFTVKNANRLRRVSILSMIESVLCIYTLLYLLISGDYNTNILIVLLPILFFAIVISIVTSMLSYLFRNASEIKQDNDLTI